MADYAQVPSTAKVQPKPFKVEIDANEIQVMKHLLAHSKIGPATYENQQTDRRFGMNRDWLINAKKHWETTYDWYATLPCHPVIALTYRQQEKMRKPHQLIPKLHNPHHRPLRLRLYHPLPRSLLNLSHRNSSNLPPRLARQYPRIPLYAFSDQETLP